MPSALTTLAVVSLLAAVLWLPYILGRFMTQGFGLLGYPENPPPLPSWAERSHRAHLNLLENLVPFTALVLVGHTIGADSATLATWSFVFLVARIVHWLAYVLKIPAIRTLAFLAGVASLVALFFEILSV